MSGKAWKIIGPGGGGALYYPTVSPHDSNIVLASCDMTCSFLTRDGGESWTELNFGAHVRSFAFDPSEADVMYAGAAGLFRSVDGGRSWNLVFPAPAAVTCRTYAGDEAEEVVQTSDNWPGGIVLAICVDPSDSRLLHIGVRCSSGIRVLRSADGGARWAEVAGMADSDLLRLWPRAGGGVLAVSGAGVLRVDADGRSSAFPLTGGREILDAACAAGGKGGQDVLFAATGSRWEGGAFRSGLYRSQDGGGTWTELSGGLDRDVLPGEARNINRVAAAAGASGVVYASVKEPWRDNTKNFGILRSPDGGDSWDWVLRMDERQPDNRETGWIERDYGTTWCGAPFWLGASPSDPLVCYATDWGSAYRTVDGGSMWRQLYTRGRPDGTWASRGVDVTNVYDLAFDPFDRGRVLMPCTDTGLFASSNGGASWRHAQAGVPEAWVNTCYIALHDPAVRGKVWTAWGNCHDLPRMKMMAGGNLLKHSGGVCRSCDGGTAWKASNAGMPENALVTHMVLDPGSPAGRRTLAAAAFGTGVFLSVDDGETWSLSNSGIEGNRNAWRFFQASSGLLYLMVAGDICSGTAVDGALYCSDDFALSWHRLPLPQGVFFPNDMDCSPGKLYLACWGNEKGQPERHGGLHVSGDGGRTWECALDESLHVYGVTVDGQSPETVYATAYEGLVLRSLDGGRTWKELEGIDFRWPKKVQIDPDDRDMIFVTTFGSCAWHGPAGGAPKAFGRVSLNAPSV